MLLPPSRLTANNLDNADIIFLLEFDFDGTVHRYASQTITILDKDSNNLFYNGTLEVSTLGIQTNLFSTSPKLNSQSVSFFAEEDFSESVSRGLSLSGIRAELSVSTTSSSYEERKVIISGTSVSPSYGSYSEPVEFSIEQNTFEDRSTILNSLNTVSNSTFDSTTNHNISVSDSYYGTDFIQADPQAIGESYPLVIGYPGSKDVFGTVGFVAGSPGLVIEKATGNAISNAQTNARLMIAGHSVGSTHVYVRNVGSDDDPANVTATSSGWSSLLAVNEAQDALGFTFSYVELPTGFTTYLGAPNVVPGMYCPEDISTGGGGHPSPHEGRTYVVQWPDNGGALQKADGTPLRTAGDVLALLMKKMTIPVDFQRLEIAASKLQDYFLDFYINENSSTWDWVEDNLLPILPISMVYGPNGVYPIVFSFEEEPAASFDLQGANTDIQRSSPIQYTNDEIFNDIRLKYRYTPNNNAFLSWIMPGARNALLPPNKSFEIDTDDLFVSENYFSKMSKYQYGTRVLELETEIVWDKSTAAKIVSWLTRKNAFNHREVSYTFDKRYSWLEPGNVIEITDSEVNFNQQRAYVTTVSYSLDGTIECTLKMFTDPTQNKGIA